MRILALIFSGIGFYGLLQLGNCTVYQFLPAHAHGPEDGMIVAFLGLAFGGGASLIALLFAFLHYRRARGSVFARLLLAWSWLLILGFLGVMACMEVDYRKSQKPANTSLEPARMTLASPHSPLAPRPQHG